MSRHDEGSSSNGAQTPRRTGIASSRLLVVSVATLTLAACGEENTYVPPPPSKVIAAQPVQRPVTRYIELTGNTAAVNTVDLEARVQGFLEKIDYKDGELVKTDALLFTIQRNTYEAQLAQAKASVASTQAAHLNAKIEYERQTKLAKDQFAAQARVDDAKQKLDQAAAAVDEATANLELSTINLGYTEVKAPFDGIVTRHLVDVGALVGHSGPTKLATIIQVDPIYVYFNVSETTVLRIREGLAKQGQTLRDVHNVPVEIGLQTEEGYPHKGVVDYVAPQVDPATGTLEVRGVFENKDVALLPGLFIRVRIPVQRIENALLVEDTSIGTSQLGEYVYVVGKDDVVEQRSIKVGQLDGGMRVIESGLTKDDWVITSGIQRAIPGNKVAPDKQTRTIPVAGGAVRKHVGTIEKADNPSIAVPMPKPRP